MPLILLWFIVVDAFTDSSEFCLSKCCLVFPSKLILAHRAENIKSKKELSFPKNPYVRCRWFRSRNRNLLDQGAQNACTVRKESDKSDEETPLKDGKSILATTDVKGLSQVKGFVTHTSNTKFARLLRNVSVS